MRSAINPAICYLGEPVTDSLFSKWETTVLPSEIEFELTLEASISKYEAGHFDEAKNLLGTARSILAEKSPDRVISGLAKLARVYCLTKDFPNACLCIQDSLKKCHPWQTESPPSADHETHQPSDCYLPEVLSLLHIHSVLVAESGGPMEAIEPLEMVGEYYGARNELELYAKILNDLGVVYFLAGKPIKAEATLRDSIRLLDIIGLPQDSKLVSDNLSAMPGLNDHFPLQDREDEKDDINTIRTKLEQEVTRQYQVLADGLLADMLLNKAEDDDKVNNIVWWYHYLHSNEDKKKQPRFDDPLFIQFRNRFIQAIALRKIRRISRTTLAEYQLDLFGSKVKCWEEGKINRLLASFGSSLRVLMISSDRFRQHALRRYIKKTLFDENTPGELVADGRFVLGEIGPISAFNRASVIHFIHEYAKAPYFPLGVEGFCEESQGRVVIRKGIESRGFRFDRDVNFDFRVTLMHEYTHFQFRLRQGAEVLSSWHHVLREDLCRFTRSVRSAQEIVDNLRLSYLSKRNIHAPDHPGQDDFEEELEEFDAEKTIRDYPQIARDLKALCIKGLIIEKPKLHYKCTLFNDKKVWNLSVA